METGQHKVSKRAVFIAILAVLALVGAAFVPIILDHVDAQKAIASEKVNAPDILIDSPYHFTFPDPMHIKLPDGRSFRLAHVIGPDPGTTDYAKAMNDSLNTLGNGRNIKRGLRIVGATPEGETLVEMWGFQTSRGGCGNRTWAEERRGRIPHWKDLTSHLPSSGNYRLLPDVRDDGLVASENYARRARIGAWANPQTIKTDFDLRELEKALYGLPYHVAYQTRLERLEAADLLLRADSKTYVPMLLAIVKDSDEKNFIVRARLAILLEKAGNLEGTIHMMNALRTGGRGFGLDRYQLSTIEHEYYSHLDITSAWGGNGPVLTYYDTKILNTIPATRPTP